SYSELLSVHFAGSATRTPVATPTAAEIDHHSGRTLKFMPSMGTGRPYSNISAATAPLACRMRRRDDGVAVVELDLEPHLLSSVGTGASAVICSLGGIAALGAVAPDREEVLSLKPISITSNLIRVVQDGTVVAEATMENSGSHIRFVSVRITRK